MTPFGIRKRIKQRVGAVVETVTALFGSDEPAPATPAAAAKDRLKADPVRRPTPAPAVFAAESAQAPPVKERVGRKAAAKAAAAAAAEPVAPFEAAAPEAAPAPAAKPAAKPRAPRKPAAKKPAAKKPAAKKQVTKAEDAASED